MKIWTTVLFACAQVVCYLGWTWQAIKSIIPYLKSVVA